MRGLVFIYIITLIYSCLSQKNKIFYKEAFINNYEGEYTCNLYKDGFQTKTDSFTIYIENHFFEVDNSYKLYSESTNSILICQVKIEENLLLIKPMFFKKNEMNIEYSSILSDVFIMDDSLRKINYFQNNQYQLECIDELKQSKNVINDFKWLLLSGNRKIIEIINFKGIDITKYLEEVNGKYHYSFFCEEFGFFAFSENILSGEKFIYKKTKNLNLKGLIDYLMTNKQNLNKNLPKVPPAPEWSNVTAPRDM